MKETINNKFFPYLNNNMYDELKIDDIGKFSISCPKDAEFITNIICNIFKDEKPFNEITITDATAGVGGNVLSFDPVFKSVNAIENDKTRYSYLVHNLKLYNSKCTNCICEDYTSIYLTLKQDVVFLDPPWGGPNYKNKSNIRLSLSHRSIESLVIDILKLDTTCVVLKLPSNYDYKYIKEQFPAEKYNLNIISNKNMNIVTIQQY